MAVPRNRHSNARKNSRRAHDAKTPKNLSTCTNCSKSHPPHHMCPFCGYYKGAVVIPQEE